MQKNSKLFFRLDTFRASFFLLFAGAALSILWSVAFSFVTIGIPYQIELREGAALIFTRLLLSRENPYTLEHQPLALNSYGLGYNLSVAPFAALFGNTLLVHRAVTFGFILLSAALIATVIFKTRGDVSLALAASAFSMIGLVGHAGIGAFSSAAGVFFFLASVLIPFLRSFDKGSLISSAILALAAFYTKPYFVLSVGIVASFLFLFVSKKTGLAYVLFFLAAFVPAFAATRSLFPLYFFNSLIANMSMSWLSYPHMWKQLSNLFWTFLPALAVFAFALAAHKTGQGQKGARPAFLRNWNDPLFNRPFDYLPYVFIAALLAFIFILGPHLGNNMNYAYQLVIPTFFCWIFSAVRLDGKFALAASLILVFNLLSWQSRLLDPRMLEQKDSEAWARLFAHVHASQNILNSQVEASEVVRLGLIPIDSGQTIVYYQVKPFADSPLTPVSYDAILADGIKYVNAVDQSIRKQKFDTIISVKEKGVFYHAKRLGDTYSVVDEIQVEMPQASQTWTILIWKPNLP